jgi:hypothetical protein
LAEAAEACSLSKYASCLLSLTIVSLHSRLHARRQYGRVMFH